MSGFGEAFTALKNIMLLQERIEGVRKDVERLNGDLGGLKDYAVSIDKRLARLEGFIEGAFAANGVAFKAPRIEG